MRPLLYRLGFLFALLVTVLVATLFVILATGLLPVIAMLLLTRRTPQVNEAKPQEGTQAEPSPDILSFSRGTVPTCTPHPPSAV